MTEYKENPRVENNKECVVLLHGLARSSRSFSAMENSLNETGYHVVNVNYPSRKQTIENLTKNYVTKAIEECQSMQPPKIHFVTHSMGGILVRHYLANHSLDNLGHVVMLSPPNQGSEVVDKLADFHGFYAINGPAGQQLATSTKSLPNKLVHCQGYFDGFSAPVISCDGVAVLDKGATIASARRLVAEHDRNAEPVKIALTVYRALLIIPLVL